jgi:hypothetical protein
MDDERIGGKRRISDKSKAMETYSTVNSPPWKGVSEYGLV